MTLDEMKRIARMAADGYPEDQEIYYATFNQKTIMRLLAVAEAAKVAVDRCAESIPNSGWGELRTINNIHRDLSKALAALYKSMT